MNGTFNSSEVRVRMTQETGRMCVPLRKILATIGALSQKLQQKQNAVASLFKNCVPTSNVHQCRQSGDFSDDEDDQESECFWSLSDPGHCCKMSDDNHADVNNNNDEQRQQQIECLGMQDLPQIP